MSSMKIGTRLTLALLLALAPLLFGRMYVSVRRSATVYVNDLEREMRATTRSLALEMENDVLRNEWDEVDDILRRMTDDTTKVALFKKDLTVMRTAVPGDAELIGRMMESRAADPEASEFQKRLGNTDWLARVVPLRDRSGNIFGYLLVAQDWTEVREDLAARTEASIFISIVIIAVVVALIPLLVRRYVSRPLAELSRKVTRFSDGELRDRYSGADEVSLLTEEFRKLDEQLTVARRDLLARHRRELELERSLQHAERLATVGTLASGLAHEIGTPMGIIRGRAEQVLHGEPVSERARKGLEIIISQIDRVSRIVRMLLDYGRSRESHRSLCDVRQIVSHAMSLVETEAARRHIAMTPDLGEEPLVAECDSGQLQQVFVNLAMNAIDAMTPQGGTLHIRARSGSDGEAGMLKVEFEDTGPGVPPQHAARVFDPFFTTKEPGNGTGMGLAVSQSIIRDHHGEISFESGSGGSKFRVTMPRAPVNGAIAHTAPSAKEDLI